MTSTGDIRIWEEIRTAVKEQTWQCLDAILRDIPNDDSLKEFQRHTAVPQLRDVMLQRANSWIEKLYEICCVAGKSAGKDLSAKFYGVVWFYWIQRFILADEDNDRGFDGHPGLYDLLLCASGSPLKQRKNLTVYQRSAVMSVRNQLLGTWRSRMLSVRCEHPQIERKQMPTCRGEDDIEAPALLDQSLSRSAEIAGESLESVSGRTVEALDNIGDLVWSHIEIVFLSEKRVQVFRRGKACESLNYAEFGFIDGRSENPTEAWAALLQFAKRCGEIEDQKSAEMEWPKFEKRVQEIRRVLRGYFKLGGDPIPYQRGYKTKFKIRLARSFDS